MYHGVLFLLSSPNPDEGHESGDSDKEDQTSSSESESDNDPEKLYCICRKPYSNRYL